MTYRERREARADRLRGWADKREVRAAADLATGAQYQGDHAFNTQPGHIPERSRLIAREHRAFASLDKAAAMNTRADNIDRAAAHAIYSDDADAADRLREKITRLENERARIKAYNAACRKAGRSTAEALALLDDAQRADLDSTARYVPYFLGKHGEMPAYVAANISGQLSKLRARLESMDR